MEHSDRFNKGFLILFFPLVIFWGVAPSLADGILPACFRLEGLKMQCTGGGGTVCTDTCDTTQEQNTCQGQVSQTICNGQQTCYGTKCCGTCQDQQANYCGTFTVCGQTCTGTKTVNCSQINCPVYATKSDTYCTTGTCIGSKTPYVRCSASNPGIDGCTCSCQVSGSSCVKTESGNCGGACSCSQSNGVSCSSQGYTKPATGQCVYSNGTTHPDQDGPCACKACPSRPSGPDCNSNCTDTTGSCLAPPGSPCQ